MKKFCAITPDRGDRPQLLKQCKKLIKQQTLKPSKHYIIDYKPKNKDFDLIDRIQYGINKARKDGFKKVYIIENDDYYPPNYFQFLQCFDVDFIGFSETIYYHIGLKRWIKLNHENRASLFCTGFNISALNGFEWPNNNKPFLDLKLWEHAYNNQCITKKLFSVKHIKPIGIKHGLGLCGGAGHFAQYGDGFCDKNNQWLMANTSINNLIFYNSLITNKA